ncbi:protein YIPF5 homolog [Danaus plexippus]|uniref:Rab GTPase-interacting factor golgi membrane protein n=1 Tax=Danaus plexippus plexippus TaxID=278856 RepID=A0A212F3A8_DANPL|nr:protein YIPF5 homolog [Danaus plexippus]OWR48221.1 Rab GTPase-interacting factor golgi membrane protein [Danaus plexippus plexippus]
MSGYPNPNDYSWQPQNNTPNYSFNTSNSFGDSQTLDFQNFTADQQNYSYDQGQSIPANNNQYYNPNLFTPAPIPGESTTETSEFDEPPLLDELEIYPDRILEKTLAVLNPFHGQSKADDANFLLKDTDIAGPIAFCLALAVCLFLSGNKAHFGYVYGLSLMSVFLMYFLLSLMSRTEGVFTIYSVASVLGYCMLPMVALAGLGIFITLDGNIGYILSAIAVIWSALSASRLFVTMSGDAEQRPLIAYPCALVNGVFALLVLF